MDWRRAEIDFHTEMEAGRRKGGMRRNSRGEGGSNLLQGSLGSFKDQTGEVGGQGEGIRDEHGLGGVGDAEPGRAFEVAARLRGIAGFGIALAADAEFPGIRIDGDIANQADRAVREIEADGDGETEGVSRISEGTSLLRELGLRLIGEANIGGGLVQALLMAEPFGGVALVIMAIAGQAVSKRAKRGTMCIVIAFETGEWSVIALVVTEADGAGSLEIIVYVPQDIIIAFTGVAEDLTDLEGGEIETQRIKTGDGQEMIVAIGRGERAGEGPEHGEAIVDDIEGFGFVTEMMFTRGRFFVLW